MLEITFLVALALQSAAAQDPDPVFRPLQHAYDALRDKKYDQAAAAFRLVIELAPNRASIHKDLAYTLLKIGENEAARDQFAEAMRLEPEDQHVALEYAFLCYESKQQAEARRVFDRLRHAGNPTADFNLSTSADPRYSSREEGEALIDAVVSFTVENVRQQLAEVQ